MSQIDSTIPGASSSQQTRTGGGFFEDDSFKKFTGELVIKYMREEETRSRHQANLLKLREKALIEKTQTELAWLEQAKRKAQDKGEDEKMPLILNKEKGIMHKLKQEQENINKMKEVQRQATENRLALLSQHSEVIKWCHTKLRQQALLNESTNEVESGTSGGGAVSVAGTNSNGGNEDEQLNESSLVINQSLLESKIMKQVKKHLSSEK